MRCTRYNSTTGQHYHRTKQQYPVRFLCFTFYAMRSLVSNAMTFSQETALTKNPKFAAVTLRKLEGERKQEKEERQQREDRDKMKKLKQADLPKAMTKLAALQKDHGSVKRPALLLPEPQISNSELEGIAKLSKVTRLYAHTHTLPYTHTRSSAVEKAQTARALFCTRSRRSLTQRRR
jgi:hypothetical protein